MFKKELALIYSPREGRTVFLMTQLPELLQDYASQYILVGQDLSSKKELFYIGLYGKPIAVAINDPKRFEQTFNAIKLKHGDSNSIHLNNQELDELITSNGGHVPHGSGRLRYLDGLFKSLVELTPSRKLEELTTRPLLSQPPPGFQQSYIEFPLGTLQNVDRDYYQSKIQIFLNYLQGTNSRNNLEIAIRISRETYQLLKLNGDPSKPPCFILNNSRKTCLQELYECGWEIVRIYGHEKPAMAEITKVPRAWLAIQPENNGKRKVIIGFMGTEILPRLAEETWWSNDRRDQPAIWAESNFFHSAKQHTGVAAYGKIIIATIEQELRKRISAEKMHNIHFELTGHSSGGMLATLLALHLHSMAPASIHAFLFATPSFLTGEQGKELSDKFPNNDRFSLHTIIAHDDPAINIYGRAFVPPENNTVYIISRQSNHSFLGVCAASKSTTLANIGHHAPGNYQRIVAELLERAEETADYRLSKL